MGGYLLPNMAPTAEGAEQGSGKHQIPADLRCTYNLHSGDTGSRPSFNFHVSRASVLIEWSHCQTLRVSRWFLLEVELHVALWVALLLPWPDSQAAVSCVRNSRPRQTVHPTTEHTPRPRPPSAPSHSTKELPSLTLTHALASSRPPTTRPGCSITLRTTASNMASKSQACKYTTALLSASWARCGCRGSPSSASELSWCAHHAGTATMPSCALAGEEGALLSRRRLGASP